MRFFHFICIFSPIFTPSFWFAAQCQCRDSSSATFTAFVHNFACQSCWQRRHRFSGVCLCLCVCVCVSSLHAKMENLLVRRWSNVVRICVLVSPCSVYISPPFDLDLWPWMLFLCFFLEQTLPITCTVLVVHGCGFAHCRSLLGSVKSDRRAIIWTLLKLLEAHRVCAPLGLSLIYTWIAYLIYTLHRRVLWLLFAQLAEPISFIELVKGSVSVC